MGSGTANLDLVGCPIVTHSDGHNGTLDEIVDGGRCTLLPAIRYVPLPSPHVIDEYRAEVSVQQVLRGEWGAVGLVSPFPELAGPVRMGYRNSCHSYQVGSLTQYELGILLGPDRAGGEKRVRRRDSLPESAGNGSRVLGLALSTYEGVPAGDVDDVHAPVDQNPRQLDAVPH